MIPDEDPRKSPFYTLAIVILIGAGLAFAAFFVLAVVVALGEVNR